MNEMKDLIHRKKASGKEVNALFQHQIAGLGFYFFAQFGITQTVEIQLLAIFGTQ